MQSLTKVLDGGAIITENCDNSGPEDLQGGDVGRKDAESTRQCGYVHLFHTGLFEKDLRNRDSLGFSDMGSESPSAHGGKPASGRICTRAAKH